MSLNVNFKEFESLSLDQWKQGVDPELQSVEIDGVEVQTYYTLENQIDIIPSTLPGQFRVSESVTLDNPNEVETLHSQLLESMAGGCNAFNIQVNCPLNYRQIEWLTAGLNLSRISLAVDSVSAMDWLALFHEIASDEATHVLEGEGASGNGLFPNSNQRNILIPMVEAPHAYQSIGAMMAKAHETLLQWTAQGEPVDRVFGNMFIRFNSGAHLLNHSASLMALRVCWNHLVEQYTESSITPIIIDHLNEHVSPGYEDRNQLISHTVDAFAAYNGGADWMVIHPIEDSRFGRRMVRNIQHLLVSEGQLEEFPNPMKGSWFFENLVYAIASKATALFQYIESEGGYKKWVENNGLEAL
jgi:hypothetical protein